MTPAENRKLREILIGLGGIVDIGARYSYLFQALYPLKDKNLITSEINYGGNASTYLDNLLTYFEMRRDDEEALSTFLNAVSERVSDQDATFIRGLIRKSRTTDWKGVDNPVWVQEKIIGENTLEPFWLIHRILEAGRAVVWIESPEYDVAGNSTGQRQRGTGFLVAPDLVLTNHHVIPHEGAAAQSVVRFNYDAPSNGGEVWTPVKFKGGGIFMTVADQKHDCTLLELEAPAAEVKPLTLNRSPVFVGNRVPIIQHPGGNEKQISQRNNFVAYTDDTELQYTTSTLPGSSGSPVFDTDYRVVGLHTSGGDIVEPTTGRTYFRNRGTRIGAVLAALEANPQYNQVVPKLTIIG